MTEEIDFMMMLGDFVKMKRKQKGWTQLELARKIGKDGTIGKNFISCIERKAAEGINTPNLEALLSVLDGGITFVSRDNRE